MTVQHFFEFTPLLMAIWAVTASAKAFQRATGTSRKTLMLLGIAAPMLMIFAQAGWWWGYAIEGIGQATAQADFVWTVINHITMLIIVLAARQDKGAP